MPLDYSQGKVYAIRSHKNNLVYIGSTIQSLPKRMYEHRNRFNRWKAGKRHYTSSFDLLEHGDAYIELIEHYPCADRSELRRRHGEIVRGTPHCVNKRIPGRTHAEYNRDHVEERKAYNRANAEKINERSKAYYRANVESKKIYNREYRLKNRDKIRARRGQQFACECGGKYTLKHKSGHEKTKRHQRFLG